ncbi:hypothetical protein, partial [Nocardia abscessus]|uniref:hypothetical protein n=1 Tax=Nocardia abscessus TaxID=120957 RepID=UPI002456B8A7
MAVLLSSDIRHRPPLPRVLDGGLPRLWLTRGLMGSGRECGLVDCLKLDWGEFAESALSPFAVVGSLD